MSLADVLFDFRAGCPIVALSSPAVDNMFVLERIMREVARPWWEYDNDGESDPQKAIPVYVWSLKKPVRKLLLKKAGVEYDKDIVFATDDFQVSARISKVLNYIEEFQPENSSKRAIFVLMDVDKYLSEDIMDAELVAEIKDLCPALKNSKKRVILLGHRAQERIFPELSGIVQRHRIELPSKEEIPNFVRLVSGRMQRVAQFKGESTIPYQLSPELLQQFSSECQGLAREEIHDQLTRIAAKYGRYDASVLTEIRDYRAKKFEQLSVTLAPPATVQPQGLKNAIKWVTMAKKLYSEEAREYGLPRPGAMGLIGVPGCGKSLLTRAMGEMWGMRVLEFNVARMMSDRVGGTEHNLLNVFDMARDMDNVILQIDEIDKMVSGQGRGDLDGGVSSRVFGLLLQFLDRPRDKNVFVVATANRVESLPPEFWRRGRWDKLFFVDLPNINERVDILKVHCENRHLALEGDELLRIAMQLEGFTGAEIEGVCIDLALTCFEQDRKNRETKMFPVTLSDFTQLAGTTPTILKSDPVEIQKIRDWAKRYTQPASEDVQPDSISGVEEGGYYENRQIDI